MVKLETHGCNVTTGNLPFAMEVEELLSLLRNNSMFPQLNKALVLTICLRKRGETHVVLLVL